MEKAFRLVSSFITARSWVLHLLFWVVFLGFLALGQDFHTEDGLVSFIVVSSSYFVAGYGSYFSYLLAKRSAILLLVPFGVLLAAAVGAYLQYSIMVPKFPQVSWLNFYPISLFVGVLLVALKFAKDLHVHLQRENEQKSIQVRLELEQLRAQVSPHFLFNTLNNLYGLAVIKSDELPNMMIRLSDLLRYSLYEAKQENVTLQKEMDYLRNYIELEQMRMDRSETVKISLPENKIDDAIRIAPLLLITYVENAFKHSRNAINREIVGCIEIEGNVLKMELTNTLGAKNEETGGFGMSNAQKRLEFIFPNKHTLTTEIEDGKFNVKLTIQLP